MEKLAEKIKQLGNLEITNYWPKDWVIRGLALLLAIFLWYFVVGEDKVDTHLLVSIELVNLPRDMVVANPFKPQLEVTVSGPRGLIDSLRRQNLSRTINLAGAETGTLSIPNTPDSIALPRGVEVLRIQPANTTLLIDRLREKTLPVQAELTGEPAEGFEVEKVQLDPAGIKVSGPQSLLDSLDRLVTMPVDISGLNSSIVRQVPLQLEKEIDELIGGAVVSTLVAIREKRDTVELEDIGVILYGRRENYNYNIEPETLTVSVTAPLSLLADHSLLANRISLGLRLGNLEPGEYQLSPIASGDELVKVESLSPRQISVAISEIKAEDPAANSEDTSEKLPYEELGP